MTCEWRLLPTHGRGEFEAARPTQGRGMFGRRGAGRWKAEPDVGTDLGGGAVRLSAGSRFPERLAAGAGAHAGRRP